MLKVVKKKDVCWRSDQINFGQNEKKQEFELRKCLLTRRELSKLFKYFKINIKIVKS